MQSSGQRRGELLFLHREGCFHSDIVVTCCVFGTGLRAALKLQLQRCLPTLTLLVLVLVVLVVLVCHLVGRKCQTQTKRVRIRRLCTTGTRRRVRQLGHGLRGEVVGQDGYWRFRQQAPSGGPRAGAQSTTPPGPCEGSGCPGGAGGGRARGLGLCWCAAAVGPRTHSVTSHLTGLYRTTIVYHMWRTVPRCD